MARSSIHTSTYLSVHNFLASLATLLVAVNAQTCYLQNGTSIDGLQAKSEEWQPCGNNSPSAPNNCCVLNPDPAGIRANNADTCLPNGLCRYNSEIEPLGLRYYRTFCADPTGKGCLDLECPAVADDGLALRLVPCGRTWDASTKWCCGADASCCNDPDSSLARTIPVDLASNATLPSTTGSPTPSSSFAAGSYTDRSTDQGLSTAAIAGIALGGGVVGLAIFALGFFIARKVIQRRTQRLMESGGMSDQEQPMFVTGHAKYDTQWEQHHEAPGDYPAVHEMEPHREPVEIDTRAFPFK